MSDDILDFLDEPAAVPEKSVKVAAEPLDDIFSPAADAAVAQPALAVRDEPIPVVREPLEEPAVAATAAPSSPAPVLEKPVAQENATSNDDEITARIADGNRKVKRLVIAGVAAAVLVAAAGGAWYIKSAHDKAAILAAVQPGNKAVATMLGESGVHSSAPSAASSLAAVSTAAVSAPVAAPAPAIVVSSPAAASSPAPAPAPAPVAPQRHVVVKKESKQTAGELNHLNHLDKATQEGLDLLR